MRVAPHQLPAERELTVAARGITKVLPIQAFHNIVSNFSIHIDHSRKHMFNACTELPPSAVYECQADTRKILATDSFETLYQMHANLQSIGTTVNSNTLEAVATVRYKPNESCITRTAQHIIICHKDNQ